MNLIRRGLQDCHTSLQSNWREIHRHNRSTANSPHNRKQNVTARDFGSSIFAPKVGLREKARFVQCNYIIVNVF